MNLSFFLLVDTLEMIIGLATLVEVVAILWSFLMDVDERTDYTTNYHNKPKNQSNFRPAHLHDLQLVVTKDCCEGL